MAWLDAGQPDPDQAADRIRQAIAGGGRAVVVGMGFIGAEVAGSLRECGLEVTAIEPFKTPLFRALGEEIGRVVEGLHRDHGVELVLGDAVAAFEGAGRLERVVTTSGRRVECELAVFGLGIEPATEVVAGTGVRVDNGIVVDDYCRTNVPGVFAAGDVANHFHPARGRLMRVEHWQNGVKQGAAAALDEIELRINLIGAVDRHVDRPGILGLEQRDAVVSRQLGSFQGSGHPSNAQPCSDPLAQHQNHVFRSRAGAQADHHPPADILHRLLRRRLL